MGFLISDIARPSQWPTPSDRPRRTADSAIARSGQFFQTAILDENASSHVALGQAYLNGIDGGEAMSTRRLDRLGVNHSAIHTDVMFGSASVSVVASTSREGEVVLMDRGRWVERFHAPFASAADFGPKCRSTIA